MARTARAGCAGNECNAVSGSAAIGSVAVWRRAADHNIGRDVKGAARNLFFPGRADRSCAPSLAAGRLEIDKYLTKVREWTRASCSRFAASTAP